MRRGSWLLGIVIVATGAACTQSAPPPPAESSAASLTSATHASPLTGRVVDLGHALSMTDPTWDGKPAFSWKAVASYAKDGYFGGAFSSEEHFGTHVDAPAHFAPGGLTVDRIPADRLVRPAVVIDISRQVQANDDYRLTEDDVKAFEQAHGSIPEGSFVCVATGWDSRWPDRSRYMNERAGVKHFPGLSVEAAKYLATVRKVVGIGIDTGSIDYGPSEKFEAHQATMGAGLYHVENATGFVGLPATGFTVIVAPIKISGGSGGPARIFAILP